MLRYGFLPDDGRFASLLFCIYLSLPLASIAMGVLKRRTFRIGLKFQGGGVDNATPVPMVTLPLDVNVPSLLAVPSLPVVLPCMMDVDRHCSPPLPSCLTCG